MTTQAFAQIAQQHGLNQDRVETARQNGLTMTTLVQLLNARPANEVDAMLIPLTLGMQSAADLATAATALNNARR